MAKLSEMAATEFAKILVVGDSGSGKTGSLISLLRAGYSLGVIDMDNGLAFMANYLRAEAPELLSRVDHVYLRDKYRYDPVKKMMDFVPPASAYMAAAKLLDKWDDGSRPSEWGGDRILVIDSLTNLGIAALNQAYTIKPTSASGAKPDGKMIYGMAQEALGGFINAVLSPEFRTNVIIISHVAEQELGDGSVKGYPTTIGQKMSRTIAKDFNDLFVVERNPAGKIAIRTVPHAKVDAKTSALKLPSSLPVETGMAEIFRAIRGKEPSKPN